MPARFPPLAPPLPAKSKSLHLPALPWTELGFFILLGLVLIG